MTESQELHSGPGMRRLLNVLPQGAPAPTAPKRYDETSSDGLVRLVLAPDGTCTIGIDHFGAEVEDGIAHVEATIKVLYNAATTKTTLSTSATEQE